jgi:hypothetical protein
MDDFRVHGKIEELAAARHELTEQDAWHVPARGS